MEGDLLCSESTDLNVDHIDKVPARQLLLDQKWHRSLAKLSRKSAVTVPNGTQPGPALEVLPTPLQRKRAMWWAGWSSEKAAEGT